MRRGRLTTIGTRASSAYRKKRGIRVKRTLEEVMEAAKRYETRGELYKKDKALYMAAYTRGWLDKVCVHMKPSRNKNKYVASMPMIAKIVGTAVGCESLVELQVKFAGAYDAGLRYGVDFKEIFERRDDAKYLQGLIRSAFQDRMSNIQSG
jgi:hypothetical protein